MRKILSFLVLSATLLFLGLYLYKKDTIKFIMYNMVYKYEVVEQSSNEYQKKMSYNYVQIDNDFYPENKQDILNVIYTAIDSGFTNFSFVCSYKYTTCEADVKAIAGDSNILTDINNFVNPFNSYDKLSITINGFGKISIVINPLYNQEQIDYINTKVDEIISQKIKSTMTIREKIRVIHDYIINITTYDKERATAIENNVDMKNNYSNIAYGILIANKAVCGGYSDLMAIFLNRFGVDNFKISTTNHVWNLVKLDGVWYHLDLTWDDPVVPDNGNYVIYDHYLITTPQLVALGTTQHEFNRNVFSEAK